VRHAYSAETERIVRAELERAAAALDAGASEDARAIMESLPAKGTRAESGHLLTLLPKSIQAHISPEQLLRAVESFADGSLGFDPDLARISFDLSPERERLLALGFESGALTGFILTAYPAREDLSRLLAAIHTQENQRLIANPTYRKKAYTLETLQQIPVTEFALRHFEARGGRIYSRDTRIATWALTRWPRDGKALWKTYAEITKRLKVTVDSWFDEGGGTTSDFAKVHEAVYRCLQPQQTLGDVLGTVELAFTNVAQEVSASAMMLTDTGLSALPQGKGTNFARLMESGIAPMNPPQFLALTTTIGDPDNPSTYPAPNWKTWEWLAGITATSVACGNSLSDGLNLDRDAPGTFGNDRVRPVLA
jgi:hypothetical protein